MQHLRTLPRTTAPRPLPCLRHPLPFEGCALCPEGGELSMALWERAGECLFPFPVARAGAWWLRGGKPPRGNLTIVGSCGYPEPLLSPGPLSRLIGGVLRTALLLAGGWRRYLSSAVH